MNEFAMQPGFEEIRQVFVTECAEGLDLIEHGLLALESGAGKSATINDIFRGAHSIKGGAATFGYHELADFTHVLETLLDQVRAGALAITPPLLQLLLEAVDCLRALVAVMEAPGNADRSRALALQQRLLAMLAPADADAKAEADTGRQLHAVAAGPAHLPSSLRWSIRFSPHRQYLQLGNQPRRLFLALAELGDCRLQADLAALPDFAELLPEELYLTWRIDLNGSVELARIHDLFDWVAAEADITITLTEQEAAPVLPTTFVPAVLSQMEAPEMEAPQAEPVVVRKDPGSIRVETGKIDLLMNLVGELVINQAMLKQLAGHGSADRDTEALSQRLAQLERTTRELQDAVLHIRMLPVNVVFSRLPRLVHDLCARLDKQVLLKMAGEHTELDKAVLEKISDPLLHLIRNAVDHGIESGAERLRAGKPAAGEIRLEAAHEGGNVVIRVSDDGRGLDTQRIWRKAVERGLVEQAEQLAESRVYDLIFCPGFSTVDSISDISGRGVGMDVVRSNIEAVGGRVEVRSETGRGCSFVITLPLTLSIVDAQMLRVASQVFVLPLLSIVETVQLRQDQVKVLSGQETVYCLRDVALPMVDLGRRLGVTEAQQCEAGSGGLLVVVEAGRQRIGLVVDELLDQHQVVIKSLEKNFVKVDCMLGATILGDGSVAFILDVAMLVDDPMRDSRNAIHH